MSRGRALGPGRLVKRNGTWLIQSRKLTVFTD